MGGCMVTGVISCLERAAFQAASEMRFRWLGGPFRGHVVLAPFQTTAERRLSAWRQPLSRCLERVTFQEDPWRPSLRWAPW